MQRSQSLFFTLILVALCACDAGSSEVARVGGREISAAEFKAYLDYKRIKVRDQEHADRLLQQYAEREALATAIEQQELLDQERLAVELNEFRKEMLIGRYFDKFLSGKVGKDAIANYYNAHAEEFADKKVHVAHVLVRTNRQMTEEERKAKRTKIQEAYSKIRVGDDFADVAKAYSEDRVSSAKGGDLGWLKEGSIDPVFSKTVFELDASKVSKPFETPFGFHVVTVLEPPQVIRKPLSAVEGDIRYRMRAKAKEAELERLREVVGFVVEEGGYTATLSTDRAEGPAAPQDNGGQASPRVPSGTAHTNGVDGSVR